jgi:hypothetical protein
MASDDRPTDEVKPKRRGKAPTLTLEASEVVPETSAFDSAAAEPIPSAEGEPAVASVETPEPAPTETAPADATETEAKTVGPENRNASESTVAEAPAPESPPPVAATPSEPAPAVAEPPRSDFTRLAAAGLIGALLTGAGGIAAQVSGYWPGANRTAGLERRLAELDRAVKDAAARPAPSTPSASSAVDLAPLTGRLDAIEAARGAIETRIAALEQRPAATSADSSSAGQGAVDLGPLNREIEALKVAVTAIAAAQRNAAAPPSQTTTSSAPSAPGVDMPAVEARVRALTGPQTERLGGVETTLQGLGTRLEAVGQAARGLEGRIAALETGRSQTDGAGRRAALVVALGGLRAAVDRGGPYAAELRTAVTLGLAPAAAQPLEAAAERGLPTISLVAQRFAAIAPVLVKAAPAPSGGGVLDRLAASAGSLVRVRPVGEAAGDDVPTVVARIEAKLGRGDLAGALADFDRLPEPIRALGANWASEARARHGVDDALRRTASDAIAALTGG